MIVVDTSALFAIVAGEPEREDFITRLEAAGSGFCSAVIYLETITVLTRRSRQIERDRLDQLLHVFGLEIADVDATVREAAVAAFDRYGKGRHPARLNIADCFSYALAKARDLPLLFKGDDFARTDIAPAWLPAK